MSTGPKKNCSTFWLPICIARLQFRGASVLHGVAKTQSDVKVTYALPRIHHVTKENAVFGAPSMNMMGTHLIGKLSVR